VNVVLLVGKIADRPFRPGGLERVVIKIDASSERRPGSPDRIEVHCFGELANEVEQKIQRGDLVEIRGRLEQRVGRDDLGEFEELRVVADRVVAVGTGGGAAGSGGRRKDGPAVERRQEADLTDEPFVRGTVKLFRPREQFGFIEAPGVEGEVFFHVNDVVEGAAPDRGDRVEFKVIQGDRGPAARMLRMVDPNSAD
jgi:cold shock CspA family protein